MGTIKSFLKIFIMVLAMVAFATNNTYANNGKGKGANTGGPANHVPGVGKGKGGPGDGKGPGKGAGQGTPQKGKNKNGDSVPLDGGLGILLAGAAFYGVKKLRKS